MPAEEAPIRVLVADDSTLMRRMLCDFLANQPDLEVVGSAKDGMEACDLVRSLRPDVVTMDVYMPRKDGVACVAELMTTCPTPIVMLSAVTRESASVTMDALAAGAVDFVAKPRKGGLGEIADELLGKLRNAPRASVVPPKVAEQGAFARSRTGSLVDTKASPSAVMLIGASTGGPNALDQLVTTLDASLPVTWVFVQHMPAGFTASLAERLDKRSELWLAEAQNGQMMARGQGVLAPGGLHLEFDGEMRCRLTDSASVNGVRPSVDVTAFSLARNYTKPVGFILMTGMGRDGADGAKALYARGKTLALAQSPETCVVAGMPRSLLELNLPYVESIPLGRLGQAANRLAGALIKGAW